MSVLCAQDEELCHGLPALLDHLSCSGQDFSASATSNFGGWTRHGKPSGQFRTECQQTALGLPVPEQIRPGPGSHGVGAVVLHLLTEQEGTDQKAFHDAYRKSSELLPL